MKASFVLLFSIFILLVVLYYFRNTHLRTLFCKASIALCSLFPCSSSFPQTASKNLSSLLKFSYKWCLSIKSDKDLRVVLDILNSQLSTSQQRDASYFYPSPGIAFTSTITCIIFVLFSIFVYIFLYFLFSYILFYFLFSQTILPPSCSILLLGLPKFSHLTESVQLQTAISVDFMVAYARFLDV